MKDSYLSRLNYSEGADMRKQILGLMVVASSLFAGDLITFKAGTPAKASEVNANFSELASRIENISSSNVIFSNGRFVRTKSKYDIVGGGEGSGNNACVSEYGSDYRIADWSDVVSFLNSASELDRREFYINLGMKPVGTPQGNNSLSVSNGTELYSSSRAYYITRHDHNKPGYYLAHDNWNNYEVSLGSWTGSRYVLCYYKK